MKRNLLRFVVSLIGSAGLLCAQGQQQPGPPEQPPAGQQQQQAEDGPGPGVARISVISGDVSVKRGDTNDIEA
ncbi:MAG: hypothetical protein ACRD4P_11735, partial [Bryobacteraceae bacterium]